MFKNCLSLAAVGLSLMLAGCGGGGFNSTATSASGSAQATGAVVGQSTSLGGNDSGGVLAFNPPYMVASVSPSALGAQLQDPNIGGLAGQQLYASLKGNLPCNVKVYQLVYSTVGALGEATQASGVLMVPFGGTQCEGARDIVMYAHAARTTKTFNIADILPEANNEGFQESGLMAATFAAQGYIAIASNYAGYDQASLGSNTLNYHAFLNAVQNSKEMIDTLVAGRSALATVGGNTLDSGRLFLTGYNEGGYVALATQKTLEAHGVAVTAVAPMAGFYPIAAVYDAQFLGNVPGGATLYTPMLLSSYQTTYGDIYSAPSDAYGPMFSTGATGGDTLGRPGVYTWLQQIAKNFISLTDFFPTTVPTVPSNSPLSAGLQDLTVNGLSYGLLSSLNVNLGSTLTSLDCQGFVDQLSPPKVGGAEPFVSYDIGFLFAKAFESNSDYLINNTFRANYLADFCKNPDLDVPFDLGLGPTTFPATSYPKGSVGPANLRAHLAANDMRSYVPKAPVMMCEGSFDASALFINSQYQAHYWGAQNVAAGHVVVVNLDNANLPGMVPAAGSAGAPLASGAWSYSAGANSVAHANSTIDYSAEINGFSAAVQAYYAQQEAANGGTPGATTPKDQTLLSYGVDYTYKLLPGWCAAATLKYFKAQ